eukprot:SAG31_NODE_2371_length_5851_cov_4.577886_6_plen_99_part_00
MGEYSQGQVSRTKFVFASSKADDKASWTAAFNSETPIAEPDEDSEDEPEAEAEIKLVDSEKAASELEQLDVSVTVLGNSVTPMISVLMHYNACYLGFG